MKKVDEVGKKLLNNYLSKSNSRTVRNSEPMPYWDAYLQWQKDVVNYFEEVKDYHGYPHLPDTWLDGMALYHRASVAEKKFIAESAMISFIEALRHWKTDADKLYPNQKRTYLPLG